MDEETLRQLYLVEKKSLLDIGKMFRRSASTILYHLRKFKIPRRLWSTKGLKPRLGAKLSEESKDKIRKKALGRRIPADVRIRMGSKGPKNPGWIDGRTPINKAIRNSAEYHLWREAVFQRDDWTCQWCGGRGGDIHADHIKPFALYPALRFAIDNGRTLCVPCHRKTDTYGAKLRLKK